MRFDGSMKALTGAVGVRVCFDHDLSKLFDAAGSKAVYAVAKAIDDVGNKTKTQVIRSVARQAGIKVGKARSVISSRQAMGAGEGRYEIVARDVTLSLKEFAPKRTAKGVSASPWGKRRVFEHTFLGPNGHVFVRQGTERLPIKKLWGPAITKEMVKGETEAAFDRNVETLLPAALEKWLLRQIE